MVNFPDWNLICACIVAPKITDETNIIIEKRNLFIVFSF